MLSSVSTYRGWNSAVDDDPSILPGESGERPVGVALDAADLTACTSQRHLRLEPVEVGDDDSLLTVAVMTRWFSRSRIETGLGTILGSGRGLA